MKPLLFIFTYFIVQTSTAQNLDYISVRNKNGRALQNFYTGSDIFLQTTGYAFVGGPIKAIQRDTVWITVFDVRLMQTSFGSIIRDTISTVVLPVAMHDISRVHLRSKKSFAKRELPALLMLGGAGYFSTNLLNGLINKVSLTSNDNVRRLGFGLGAFVLGYWLQHLFYSDGFSTKKQKIVYVKLSADVPAKPFP